MGEDTIMFDGNGRLGKIECYIDAGWIGTLICRVCGEIGRNEGQMGFKVDY